MTLLELGPDKFKLWVHRGEQLKTCKMIRLNANLMKRFLERLNKLKVSFGEKRVDEKGRVKLHGEP
jgi:hypothetical protein